VYRPIDQHHASDNEDEDMDYWVHDDYDLDPAMMFDDSESGWITYYDDAYYDYDDMYG
jgi:hypothetical protein